MNKKMLNKQKTDSLEYRLYGFYNLFNINPGFIYPIFKGGEKHYLQTSNDFIEIDMLDFNIAKNVLVIENYDFKQPKENIYAFLIYDRIVFGSIPYIRVCISRANLIFDNYLSEYIFMEEGNYLYCGSIYQCTKKTIIESVDMEALFEDCTIADHNSREIKLEIVKYRVEPPIDFYIKTSHFNLFFSDLIMIKSDKSYLVTRKEEEMMTLLKQYAEQCLYEMTDENFDIFLLKFMKKKAWLLTDEQYEDIMSRFVHEGSFTPENEERYMDALDRIISLLADITTDIGSYTFSKNNRFDD